MILDHSALTKVQKDCLNVLRNNRIKTATQTFTVASLRNPIYAEMQAFWDSCFHAYVLASVEPEYAKKEIIALLTNMNEEGFIPHMIYFTGKGKIVPDKYKSMLDTFWSSSYHSDLIQPPILALAVNEIYENTQDNEFLVQVLPKLQTYYRFLSRTRDHDKDSLLSIIHSWESGWDNSQRWDALYNIRSGRRGEIDKQKINLIKKYQKLEWNIKDILELNLFTIKPVDFNVLYAWNLEILSKLCKKVNLNDSFFKEQAHKTSKAIFHKMFNGDSFFDLFIDDTHSEVHSAAMFFPMLLNQRFDYTNIVNNYLKREEHFFSPNGIPSTSLSHPLHSPCEYWRGNIWIQLNWLIFRGLLVQQESVLATELANRIIRLLSYNGFWEYFNPHTGKGLGASDYSWDSLVYPMISSLHKLATTNAD